MPPNPPSFRRAYVPRPGPLGGVTPAAECEAAVLAVVEAWNAAIPRNRVRILTSQRFYDARAALATFTRAEIIAAVEFYGRQTWQRKRGAWKTFDNWILIPCLTGWVEEAMAAAERAYERAAAQKVSSNPQVAELQRRIGRREAEMKGWDALARRFMGLPEAERARLVAAARAELRKLLGPLKRVEAKALQRHALVVMRREER